MEKFLKKFSDVTDHGHCIIKEELIISDSDEEIDVEKADKEIYSIPRNDSFSDSQDGIKFDKLNKSNETLTSRKSERIRSKNVGDDNKEQTIQDLYIKSKNFETNDEESENSTNSTNNQEPKGNIKTAECDIETLVKKLAKSFCNKCREESPVKRWKARCNKCNTQFSYVCHACDNTYSTITELGYHLEMKHMKFPMIHSCTICSKTFTYRKALQYHSRNKHNTYHSLHCSVCDKKFSRSVNKVLHEKVCGKQKIYKCEQCSFTAGFKSHLANHILEKHSGFKEKCKNCSKVFTNPRSIKRHAKVYCEKTKMVECDHCGHKVCGKDEMVKHLDQFHMNSMSDQQLRDIKICQDRDLTLASHERMKYHKSTLQLKGTLESARSCPLCGLNLVRYERMEHHRIKCQSVVPLLSDPSKKGSRICEYCGEAMRPHQCMRYHVEQCESVPLAVRYSAELTKLPDMNTAISKLAVSYCVKCKIKETLKYGVRRCSTCKKLLKHACESCSKNFLNSNLLRVHLRVKHVRNFKFYRCNECPCSYNRKGNLMKHQRECHSDKPIQFKKDEKCGNENKSSMSLRRPRRKHMISE